MGTVELTAEYVRERLDYDPKTGIVTWRTAVGQRTKVGDPVGYKHPTGYRHLKLLGKSRAVHRLVWLWTYGTWPSGEIDHINGVRDDNRLSNLRDVPKSTNMENQRKGRSDNDSGLIGAHYRKNKNMWTAAIRVNKTARYLGIFSTPEEAHSAYLTAKRRLHVGCTI